MKTTLERFNELMADDQETPLERLRFFCSLAMNGQDWLDVEPFFDALATQPQQSLDPEMAQILHDHASALYSRTDSSQPQAPQGAEAKRLREALVCTREALEHANNMKGGPIIDTIWYDASETLFDYIDSVLAAPKTETPEGEQV